MNFVCLLPFFECSWFFPRKYAMQTSGRPSLRWQEGLCSPPPHPPLFIPFVILQKLTWVLSSSWLPSPGFAFSYQWKAANRRKTFPHWTVSSAAFRHNGHPLPTLGSTFLRVFGAIRIDCRQRVWMGNSLVLWACICPKRVYVQSRPFSFVCSPCCILLEWGWLHWSH